MSGNLQETTPAPAEGAATSPVAVPAERLSYGQLVAKLSGAQKSSVGAPGYSRWVNRRLGRYIAAAAYQRGLTPNNVTGISATFTFAAIALLALVRPYWWVAVLVTAGLVLGYAFDSADGQLARLRGGGSPAGEWLDHVVDCTKCSALHLAVLISWARFSGFTSRGWLLIPIAYTLVSAVWFFAVVLSEQLRRPPAGTPKRPASSEPAPALRSLIVLPADYGVLALIFITIGARDVFIVLYIALLVANTFFLVTKLAGWYRELAATPH